MAKIAKKKTRSPAGGGVGERAEGAAPRIAYVIGRLDRTLRRRMGEVIAQFGLTVAHYTALSVLSARGQLSNAQLAKRSFITPQAMNEVIKVMEAKKLLVRKPDPLHGRIVQLSLTRAGEELLRQCDKAVELVEAVMLESLSAADRTQLITYMRTCIHALDVEAH